MNIIIELNSITSAAGAPLNELIRYREVFPRLCSVYNRRKERGTFIARDSINLVPRVQLPLRTAPEPDIGTSIISL